MLDSVNEHEAGAGGMWQLHIILKFYGEQRNIEETRIVKKIESNSSSAR